MGPLTTLRLARLTASAGLAVLAVACSAPTADAQGRPAAPFVGAVLTGGGTVNALGVVFAGPGGGEIETTEADTLVILPGGTIKNLRVFLRPTGQNQGAAVFTVMVNGAATALTCVVPVAGICRALEAITIEESSLVTLRAINQLLQIPGIGPWPTFSFTYSFELE